MQTGLLVSRAMQVLISLRVHKYLIKAEKKQETSKNNTHKVNNVKESITALT